MPQNAEAKNVNERIALEAFVEINFAADGRDADAIAVVRDAADNAGEQTPIVVDFDADSARDSPVIGSEAQRIQTKSGRAPIVKMSRMIPPTPVAAPWNGSIALG